MKLSVGLPLYKMGNIAWLAIESLINQVEAPEWELLVIEEQEEHLGLDYILKNWDRLQKAGCTNYIYIPLMEWMPLGNKWIKLLEHAKGEIFLLHAGDCYSQPYRLKETWELRNYDWIQSARGLFYDIETQKTILFDKLTYSHPCGLNMAFKTKLGKRLNEDNVRICVDSWLYSSMHPESVGWMQSDNWKLGLDTNGRNKLSVRKKYFEKPTFPFVETNLKPDNKILTLLNEGLISNK